MNPISQSLPCVVSDEVTYHTWFTQDVFALSNPTLREALGRRENEPTARAMVVIDSGVARAHPGVERTAVEYLQTIPSLEVAGDAWTMQGGEGCKHGPEEALRLAAEILSRGLCRHSFVVAVGGGAVLDTCGFAASMAHRGVRMVRLPTTTLAQADAGLGVKNGVNFQGQKNALGAFAAPHAVVCDSGFLHTLDDRNWRAGIAESFKVALIKDARFFHSLCGLAPRLGGRDHEALKGVTRRCAEIHIDHIANSGDPYERGSARPLDFGHWSAHFLEIATDHHLLHGEAVAIGIALDAVLARQRGWIADGELTGLLGALQNCGLPVWHNFLELSDEGGRAWIAGGLESFRQHLGGALCLAFPGPIGQCRQASAPEISEISEAIATLRELCPGALTVP